MAGFAASCGTCIARRLQTGDTETEWEQLAVHAHYGGCLSVSPLSDFRGSVAGCVSRPGGERLGGSACSNSTSTEPTITTTPTAHVAAVSRTLSDKCGNARSSSPVTSHLLLGRVRPLQHCQKGIYTQRTLSVRLNPQCAWVDRP